MRVKINLNGVFRYFSVIYKNQEYSTKNKDSIFLEIDDNDRKIYIKNNSKSSVSLDWLDIFLEMFYGESTTTSIYSDYSFEILSNENCEITIKENDFIINDRMKYLSFCAVSDNALLGNDCFITGDTSKLIKKHRKLHLFLLSGLPLYILVAILALVFDYSLFWIFIMIFLLFTLPSIKQRKKFKKYLESPIALEALQKNVIGFRTEKNYEEKIMTKTDKFFFKLFEKLFNTEAKK